MFNPPAENIFRQVLTIFIMLSIPPEMNKINQFIITNIPSAKDLYEKMGFRYQNGLGHNSVENASGAVFVNQSYNANIEGLYGVTESLENDLQSLNSK